MKTALLVLALAAAAHAGLEYHHEKSNALEWQRGRVKLGNAVDFSGFFRDTIRSMYSDSEGPLAAGKNVYLKGFSVQSDPFCLVDKWDKRPLSLAVGGNLEYSDGEMARSRGVAQVAGHFSGSARTVFEHVKMPGHIDFAKYHERLVNSSRTLCGAADENAWVEAMSWGPAFKVHTRKGSSFAVANLHLKDGLVSEVQTFTDNPDQTLVINLRLGGQHLHAAYGQHMHYVGMQRADGMRSEVVLFNVCPADDTVDSHAVIENVGWFGAFLAPNTHLRMVGHMTAQVFAASWDGIKRKWGMEFGEIGCAPFYGALCDGDAVCDHYGMGGAKTVGVIAGVAVSPASVAGISVGAAAGVAALVGVLHLRKRRAAEPSLPTTATGANQ